LLDIEKENLELNAKNNNLQSEFKILEHQNSCIKYNNDYINKL
jgi:hypothetical protein